MYAYQHSQEARIEQLQEKYNAETLKQERNTKELLDRLEEVESTSAEKVKTLQSSNAANQAAAAEAYRTQQKAVENERDAAMRKAAELKVQLLELQEERAGALAAAVASSSAVEKVAELRVALERERAAFEERKYFFDTAQTLGRVFDSLWWLWWLWWLCGLIVCYFDCQRRARYCPIHFHSECTHCCKAMRERKKCGK
ncbi:hypothetical protein CYMTET_41072 [Cymbomonas tetramitiformis]|uniref:Uncharacterized protein n=1 Tax=Cymbomonas tetramitiformis TaxID=36881 RepID=A0AAE0F2X5_9CHLO|nr:hypothetical protein CYMTET_41072 [Cymbomonas tetramitiformis]